MGLENSPLFIYLSLIIAGLALGSFATALAHRVPAGKSIGIKKPSERSACPHCNHVLKVIDLVPVMSWISTGGKCRYCTKSISISYPLMELAVLMACLVTYWVKGLSPDTFFIIAAIPFFAAMWLIDLRHMILPNMLLLIVAGIGLARMIFKSVLLDTTPDATLFLGYALDVVMFAAFSWVLGYVMEKIMKKEALGMGDVKFFAMTGLWIELSKIGWFCGLSGLFGVLFAFILRNHKNGGAFPFGPALITALFLVLLGEGSLF